MLATLVDEPFDEPGWVYEEKYDGIRVLAYKEGSRVTLLSRNDKNRTASFQGIVSAIAALKPSTLLLDGEVIALDSHKISRFQLLQRGIGRACCAVFDCMYKNGRDLRREPFSNRRTELERSVCESDVLILSRSLSASGLQAFRVAKRRSYEGLVAKRLASVYVEGRSREWLKVKVHQEDEFILLLRRKQVLRISRKPGADHSGLAALLMAMLASPTLMDCSDPDFPCLRRTLRAKPEECNRVRERSYSCFRAVISSSFCCKECTVTKYKPLIIDTDFISLFGYVPER